MRARTLIIAIPISLLMWAGIIAAGFGVKDALAACAEDRPCWNWATMGDGHRGVVMKHTGLVVAVDACQFVALRERRAIRYPRSQRMKGDRDAFRVCRRSVHERL